MPLGAVITALLPTTVAKVLAGAGATTLLGGGYWLRHRGRATRSASRA
jgi:hypothetical protein